MWSLRRWRNGTKANLMELLNQTITLSKFYGI